MFFTTYYQFFLQNGQNSSHGESYERIANCFELVCCLCFDRTEFFSDFWGNKCCKQSCVKQYTFYRKLRIDDYKDGRVFFVQDISDMKNKIEVSWGLSVAECVKNFKFNHVLYSMTPKVQTKTVSNAYNLLKEGQLNLSLESVMDGMGTQMIYHFWKVIKLTILWSTCFNRYYFLETEY